MANLKCNTCGGILERNDDGTHTCSCCGAVLTDIYDPEFVVVKEAYSIACKLQVQGTVDSLIRAISLFTQIEGFRDSDSKKASCEKALAELKAQKEQREREAAKREKAETRKKAKKKFFSFVGKFIVIACIICGIVGGCVYYPKKKKQDHNIDNIKIDIIKMWSEFEKSESYYYDGEYYVCFDYEIKNETNVDIDYIEVITYFKDKNGKSMGTVQSSFGNRYSTSLNLKKDDKVIKEICISERELDKDKLTTTLYESKLEDWEITHKIIRVSFSDGYEVDTN